jgi:hypothetical protein
MPKNLDEYINQQACYHLLSSKEDYELYTGQYLAFCGGGLIGSDKDEAALEEKLKNSCGHISLFYVSQDAYSQADPDLRQHPEELPEWQPFL